MSSSTPASPPSLIKSTKVWFNDGTIVIQAEATLFRVYKGLLQRDSTIFDDLFSLPQPASAPTYEGVLLVEVQDAAQDMEMFLDVLHQWRQSTSGPGGLGLKRSLAVAQLAAKYCVDELQQWTAKPLNALYGPSTLEEWLADRVQCGTAWQLLATEVPIGHAAEEYPSEWDFQAQYLARSELTPTDHILAVNMARRLNLPQLLPFAYYAAATSVTVEQLLDGVSGLRFGDPKDARICVEGKQRLATLFDAVLHLAVAMREIEGSARDCTTYRNNAYGRIPRCSHRLRSPHATTDTEYSFNIAEKCTKTPDIRSVENFYLSTLGVGWCANCQVEVKAASRSYREAVWKALEGVFQIRMNPPALYPVEAF